MARARNTVLPANIRSQPIELLGMDRRPVTTGNVVVTDGDYPEVVMFNGDAFLGDGAAENGALLYRQVRPYRFAGKASLGGEA